jgi:hypothetical protein
MWTWTLYGFHARRTYRSGVQPVDPSGRIGR